LSLFLVNAGLAGAAPGRSVKLISAELDKRKYGYFLLGFRPVRPGEKSTAGLPIMPLDMERSPSFLVSWRLTRLLKKRHAGLVHVFGTGSERKVLASALKAGVSLKAVSLGQSDSIAALRQSAAWLDALIVPTEGMKAVAVRGGFAEDSVEVVPPGIDFTDFETAKGCGLLRQVFAFGQDDFLVGVVGHLADRKTYQALINAAASLEKRARNLKIIVLGTGDLDLGGEGESAGRSTANVFYYLGFENEMSGVLGSLDAFVMYSHMEGLGVKIIQAMASELPVVAADIRGLPEVVVQEETGLLVPVRDSKALAGAVLKLYSDRAFGSRLSRSGREAVLARYSEEAAARKVVDFYERLAVRKGVKLA